MSYQFSHPDWRSCSFWDLVQPSFMFMVGVAVPYSVASRRAKGDSQGQILGHALWRSLILIFLGVFLSSNGAKQTDWTFVNVLSQIGLGYTLLFLLAFAFNAASFLFSAWCISRLRVEKGFRAE
jgi:predicted acyltransferase